MEKLDLSQEILKPNQTEGPPMISEITLARMCMVGFVLVGGGI